MSHRHRQSIDLTSTGRQPGRSRESVDSVSLQSSRRDALKGLATAGIGAGLGIGGLAAGSDAALAQPPSSDGQTPHPYYPRPDMDRRPFTGGEWLSLNGTWEFTFDPEDIGEDQEWYRPGAAVFDREIRVPFPYQSLAAFGNQDEATYANYSGEFGSYVGSAWYRRKFTVPESFPADGGSILRIGAVDWSAKVWIDGELVATHEGGYTPFDVDLGDLEPDTKHTIVIRSWDPGEDGEYPAGKQVGWYEEVGGIWQNVWLEPRGDARLSTVHVTPNLTFDGDARTPSSASVTVDVETESDVTGTATVSIREVGVVEELQLKPLTRGETVEEATVDVENGSGSAEITVPDPALWEIDEPNVYTASVELEVDGSAEDGVLTTFGMRQMVTDWAPGHSPEETDNVQDQYQYMYLNNRPIYLQAVLDQGFNPWGVYTFTGAFRGPSLEGSLKKPRKGSILYDVRQAKGWGLNCLRLHIKTNNPLYYHFADLMGMMVWQDTPNKWGFSEAADERFDMVFRNEIEYNYNHPSITIRSPFNEEWGLTGTEQLARYARLSKELDPTRIVCDNSGWEHTPETDLNDYHDYTGWFGGLRDRIKSISNDTYPGSSWNYRTGEQSGEPMLNGEVAAMAANASTWHDVSWSYKWITDLMRRDPKHDGFVYTEFQDQEWELNGMMLYDRTLQYAGYLDTDREFRNYEFLNTDDIAVFDAPPVQTVAPGETVEAPVYFSHFSDRDLSDTTLRWEFTGTDRAGEWVDTGIGGSESVSIDPYTVPELHTVSFEAPEDMQGGYLRVWIEADGDRVGENFVNVEVYDGGDPAVESTENRHTLRIDPTSPTDASWNLGTGTFDNDGAQAKWGFGRGHYEYEVAVPDDVPISDIKEASIVFEASAGHRDRERTSQGALHISQTDERLTPANVTVSVDGEEQTTVPLPDDPADSRGYLSYHNGTRPGGHGYRVELPVKDVTGLGDQLESKGTATLSFASTGGGLRLYGERTGRYGISPQLNLYTDTGNISKDMPESQVRSDVGPTLTVGTPNYFDKQEPFEVVATFVNPNDEQSGAVRDVQFSLDSLPSGWTSKVTSGSDKSVVIPGDAAFAIFEVEPSTGASAGISDVHFDVRVSYRGRKGAEHTLKESASVDPAWRFHRGDDSAWADPDYDDSDWSLVELPYNWDNHGYTEDNVYGWFRTTVTIPEEWGEDDDFQGINLPVGQIDDVDATYVNGTKVGQTGLFPGDEGGPEVAWWVQREYAVPREHLNFGGENVIAVRVWDDAFAGGITGGPIGPITKWVAQPELSLDTEFVDAGAAMTIGAMLNNVTNDTLQDASFSLQAPGDWTVEPVSTSFDTVGAESSVTATWEVTAPADATKSMADVTAAVQYEREGERESAEATASVTVMGEPDDGNAGLSGVSYWSFDEGSGDTAADGVGSNDAALVGDPTWTDGYSGQALQFDGTDDYVDAGASVLDTASDYSVSAWVKFDDFNGFQTVVSQDAASDSAFFLQYSGADDRLAFSTSELRALDNEPPETGRWYHMVGVMENYRNRMKLYVDGDLVASEPYDGNLASNGNTVIARGKFGGNQVDFTNGVIDEVRVFEKALSADEVSELQSSTR